MLAFSRAACVRLGAVSFVQRFGSALNAHVHFHCCVIDGVFAVGEDGRVHFAAAADTIAVVTCGNGLGATPPTHNWG